MAAASHVPEPNQGPTPDKKPVVTASSASTQVNNNEHRGQTGRFLAKIVMERSRRIHAFTVQSVPNCYGLLFLRAATTFL